MGSGGVAILISDETLKYFNLTHVDTSIDSIVLVTLKHRISEYTVTCFSCYTPPEKSAHGDANDLIYEQLLHMLYHTEDSDLVVGYGDFNAKIGAKHDYIAGCDDMAERHVFDEKTNKQGDDFSGVLIRNQNGCS